MLRAVICDIDGTLVEHGVRPVVETVERVNRTVGTLFVVTGRPESQRERTAETLAAIGLRGHELWMTPDGADQVAFKVESAGRIMADHTVTDVFEDDPAAIGAYEGLGLSVGVRSMKTPVEPRTPGSGVEFRAIDTQLETGDGRTFVGYAAVFDSPSEPLPFIERIRPGAFARTLSERKRDVRLYVNHNSDMVLASKRSGTLRLSEDDRGLRVEADLPETTAANDLRTLMQAGVVDRMSFGFSVPRGGDVWSEDGRSRELRELVLHEVSVVTGFPAYEATAAAVRSLEAVSARTGRSVDDLSDAFTALAAGEQIDPETAEMLSGLLAQSMPQPEPEPEPDMSVSALALEAKKLELMSKLW